MYSLLTALALGSSGCEREVPLAAESRVPQAAQQRRDSALAPIADTYIRQGNPNQNQGTELILRLTASGKNRALVHWNPQAIAEVVGTDSLVAARLELTIAANADNWGTTGRTIDLHRLTQAWTEGGATWNCADDTNPTNPVADCSGATAWAMDGPDPRPYAATPTATRMITNGLRGVVTFDVTADVRGLSPGGGAQDGWILKKTDEGASGQVEFGSRESGSVPRLVLTIGPRSGPPGATWPVLTNTYPDLDTSRVVKLPDDTFLVYRTDITLRFKAGISDSAKAAFFSRDEMTVLGVTQAGMFFVRIPDPGASAENFFQALEQLRREPEILLVASIERTPMPNRDGGRLPTDGSGQGRTNWLNGSTSTWAMRAIRAPLAWGCETGDYGGTPVPVGVFEWKHQVGHPEFARSTPRPWDADDTSFPGIIQTEPPDTVAAKEAHAVATTGLLSAEGDNGSGMAGVSWRTGLYLYSGYSRNNRKLPLYSGFYLLAGQLVSDGPRILSLSADDGFPSSLPEIDRESRIHLVAGEIQDLLLERLPSLLVVVAAGNERYQDSVPKYLKDPRAALLRGALLLLRGDPRYRDRIIVVAGTEAGNRFWDLSAANPAVGSNFFEGGATDIAAPAEDVRVLARWTGQTGSGVPLTTSSGTSLAAPLVAGVAAQLWAMDPSLTAADVKRYILRGAQEPRLSPTTGLPVAPTSVANAPEAVYQLDAYGALSLLAREQPSTPICGF
ncbi:MAG: S8 family serine peptidase, partial [Tepidiformaceae bacterium]